MQYVEWRLICNELLINAGFGRPRGDTKNKSDLSPENFLCFSLYIYLTCLYVRGPMLIQG